jgi:hypothetical protein
MDAAVNPLGAGGRLGTRWDQQGMGSAFGKPTARQDFTGLMGLMRGDIPVVKAGL